jgi:tetrapyrrole methylase family protein/MazG family protein
MTTKTIWIVGTNTRSSEINALINSAGLILARGKESSDWLKEISANAWQELFAAKELPIKDQVEMHLEQVAAALNENRPVVYVTSMNPLTADSFAAKLVKRFEECEFHWIPGEDLTASTRVQKVMAGSICLSILDGISLEGKYHFPVDPGQPTVLYYPQTAVDIQKLSELLKAVYGSEHEVLYLLSGRHDNLDWEKIPVGKLDLINGAISILVIPARAADSSLTNFEEVIAHLRAPNGCPWDRKQTHDSLRTYLLEETYEALDALDKKDMEGLCEELGDIVLQIALHAQIAQESGEFNMADILEGINRKIIFRHPHVFGDVEVDGVSGVLQNWEKLKEKERAKNGKDEEKGLLDGIPESFPALAQAQSIQDRAARVGFDWKEIEPVMAKVMEEFEEVQTAPNDEERAKELGDLLFAVVNLVRWYKVDAESALRGTNQKFRRRFSHIEKTSKRINKPMQEMTLDEMDSYWDEAKKEE